MNWFLLALAGPFLWAVVNIFDAYLIDKYSQKEKERSSGGLVIFSSLVGIFIAFFISLFTTSLLDIPAFSITLLLLTGCFSVVWIILYLYTLEIEEISTVAPWFLAVPVFGYFLGYFILGEVLNFNQILGSIIILIGLTLISINWNKNIKAFKKKVIFYMVPACLLIALSGIIFKFVALENSYWVASFWEYLGLGISGLFIYIFVPKHRDEFKYMNKAGGRKIFMVNIISELMTISGNLLTNFALLLAPVAMIYLVGSFQPAVVLFLAILGTKFYPHFIKEDISFKNLFPKMVAILLMIIGSVILFL